MNKTAIRNFATWARVTLKEEMQQKAGRLGITPNCIQKPLPSSTSEVLYFEVGASTPLAVEGKAITVRKKIEKHLLQDKTIPYGTAYQALMEEMASTWSMIFRKKTSRTRSRSLAGCISITIPNGRTKSLPI